MKLAATLRENPLLRRLIQPKRIPLLFSVTIVAGIFYHYAPKLTWLWIILSLVLQGLLFKLFDYVKKHPLIGGIAYVMTGALFVFVAVGFIRLGMATPPFAPEDTSRQLDFLVWFLTPQSVLTTGGFDEEAAEIISRSMELFSTEYLGYTLALFTLFTMFIATTAYYFTLVRYRVLMSFVVMIFPFAIYAKENETMPVPSIIILLLCYFAVMIYCRQAHGEDSDVVQKYEPDAVSRLSMPSKKSAYAKVKPEFLDGTFFNATGIFMAAATILILVLPKPEVEADRALFDSLLDFSALSDVLMDAISAFSDSSDGGDYNGLNYKRTLFYATNREPLNLRMRTYSNYDYETDSWYASDYDGMPEMNDPGYMSSGNFLTLSETADPAEIAAVLRQLAKRDPDFAKTYGLEAFAALPEESFDAYYYRLEVESATYGKFMVFPAPLHVNNADIFNYMQDRVRAYMNRTGVLFRYMDTMYFGEKYSLDYLSERYAATETAQTLMHSVRDENWTALLSDAMQRTSDDPASYAILEDAFRAAAFAEEYGLECEAESQTPERVRELAEQLTEGLDSDYDKAMAIRDYLRYSDDFIYSRDYRKTDAENVETFLFDSKTGVCYQYATAMTELCRSVGLTVRYVEGYQMSEQDRRVTGGAYDYVITTDHGHAFVDVYLPGYGWMMFDATSGNVVEQSRVKVNVLAMLQFSGLFLFGAALLLILLLKWVIPRVQEALFRSKFRKKRDAAVIAEAFARLRKQWNADPAATASTLCAEKSDFLQLDLQPLREGFESAVYAERCDAETADKVYQVYCAAYDGWKPACKRKKQAEKQARKAARRAAKAV